MLADINHYIATCQRCPRLRAYCAEVARVKRRAYQEETYWGQPVPAWGDPAARVLLVGLAPGAHGSNRTGRMFTGDGSADFLTPALHQAGFANQPTSLQRADGLQLHDLYVVAAAHCAPPDNKPTPAELANCRPYLVAHLQALPQLRVVVALGKIAFDNVLLALRALAVTIPTPLPKFGHGVEYPLGPYTLLSSYHPSRQNTQTGRLTVAMFNAVWAQVRAIVEMR